MAAFCMKQRKSETRQTGRCTGREERDKRESREERRGREERQSRELCISWRQRSHVLLLDWCPACPFQPLVCVSHSSVCRSHQLAVCSWAKADPLLWRVTLAFILQRCGKNTKQSARPKMYVGSSGSIIVEFIFIFVSSEMRESHSLSDWMFSLYVLCITTSKAWSLDLFLVQICSIEQILYPVLQYKLNLASWFM